MKVPVQGGTPVTLATGFRTSILGGDFQVALDDTSVYWADGNNGLLELTPK